MRKFFCALAVVLFVFGCAYAEMPDFSGMTQAEILDVINTGRNAMVLSEERDELLRVETNDGITIIITGMEYTEGKQYAHLQAIVVNDSDTDFTVTASTVYINGWKCNSGIIEDVNAHRRVREEWGLRITDTPFTTQDEIEDIEIYFVYYPVDGRSRDGVKLDPVIISFK